MSSEEITFTLNGNPVRAAVDDVETLVDILRRDCGVGGVRVGCRNGDCGSCTAMVDDACVKTCLMLAGRARGSEVVTLEGLGSLDRPHPVQTAFMETYAFQCGFCLPGMVLSTISLLARIPQPDETEIRDALSGNLCRCTGYENIVKAVQRAAQMMQRAPK
ncbi:aerobic-type carbon monoxide dehydrogenase small subunit (CoxS/CutS family) [Streptomyces sp. SAI-117]|uniref:(2Fe-2S)-binding protein n=1 Tax=Streptomyces sp. SAI-117 TaxID=2940546 RepID=UPI0024734313|nr:2Fe-2S iron-sulfur cluster-binding protein [Streptomyces sp. SAI-117]MDH6573756.1 aerobic-type carbon monoxide dehydrogenase small subunit (CoxS/CutS family) [Streptomyces sp. SAI-117]